MTVTIIDTRQAQAADDAWQAEIVRLFGKQAGNARYDDRGHSTPHLADLQQAKYAADRELHEAFATTRGIG
jgi:hypothetical protein